MTTEQIISTAQSLNAIQFINFLKTNKIEYMVLDQDNMLNENDGYYNLEIDGIPNGESLLFVDGKYDC